MAAFGRPSIKFIDKKSPDGILKYIKVKDSTDDDALAEELKFLINENSYWEDALIALRKLNPKMDSKKVQKAFQEKEGISPDSYQVE